MSWLAEYWVWVMLGGGFLGLHLFGHRMGGGCGGHAHGLHARDKSDEAGRLHPHERDL